MRVQAKAGAGPVSPRTILLVEDEAIGMALGSTEGRWLKVNRVPCKILGY